MNFLLRKVFAPLSAVREKSTGRGYITNTCYGLHPHENVPPLEKQTQKLGSAATLLVARTKLPQKKSFPSYNFVLFSFSIASAHL